MKVLGIDTSGYANAIGVVDDGRVLADLTFEAKADSLQKIVANTDMALKKAGLTLEEIEGIGVGLGPGSWTGIRVGVTVAKILAYSTGRPAAGVSTLEALAFAAMDTAGFICPIIGAGIGDTVYAGFYRASENGPVKEGEYYVGSLQGLTDMIKEPVALVGADIETYGSAISEKCGFSIPYVIAVEATPEGSAIALLASKRLTRGESDDVLSLTPLYLKESTAKALVGRYSGNTRPKDE
jgi:tRNA threonylcarbamoyladenosine biosynthesis protein TsaB